MKVLISDNLGDTGVQIFKAEGLNVDVKTGLTTEALKEIIGEYEGLVIRSATKVTADLLEAATNLKVVGRAGIGLDNVDIPAATKKGVVVMNTPGGNVVTTAEHAIAMMMAAARNIPQGTMTLKAGRWDKKYLQGRELTGKTLGIIGFGKIGSVVADRARGLKMRVVIHDPVIQPDVISTLGFESVTLEELYNQSDFITIHVPKSPNTANMISQKAFEMMKEGVMLINCARGGIVDEGALYDALKSGKVARAALDVFEVEPPAGDHPLLTLENVIATPHLGASTLEAQTNVAVAVANQIVAFLKHNNIINAVNVPSVSGKTLEKLSPFLHVADRMGSMQAQFAAGQIKEISIDYKGDFQDMDLTPVTTAFVKGLLDYLVPDNVNSVNALAIAKEMGIKLMESSSLESDEFVNLVNASVVTTEGVCSVAGTIFGKTDARIVRIDDFRIEIIPEGHLALIHNLDKPGAIGAIGRQLGDNNINISRMQVGRELGGDNNIILIRTDSPVTPEVAEQILALEQVKSIKLFEL
jgi:D-3-phosphoglycerate dehydrogenase / 2-oxoglutarate reductase